MSDTSLSRQPLEVRFRGGGFAPGNRRWVGLAVFVVVIGFVEWGTRVGFI
ncbi:ABC transporter permease, partial [Rhodobacteraceae bacterium R_SAG5]|nr:ABC transporter permease [Rhodobacteraceae bacterium R_SAG5]